MKFLYFGSRMFILRLLIYSFSLSSRSSFLSFNIFSFIIFNSFFSSAVFSFFVILFNAIIFSPIFFIFCNFFFLFFNFSNFFFLVPSKYCFNSFISLSVKCSISIAFNSDSISSSNKVFTLLLPWII